MTCACGHRRDVHEHYRRGTDCSAPGCRCRRFRRPWLDRIRGAVWPLTFAAGLASDVGRRPRHP